MLRTQAGVCRIDQIADLPGVGAVWYYPNGVANILLSHKLIVDSKWKMTYSTNRYYQTGDVNDLLYQCTTSRGVKVDFKPTPEDLHIMQCSKYFGLGKNGCVFGQKITDNNTNFGDAMGMCNNCIGILNNSQGIDTMKDSKTRFSERDQKQFL